METRLFIASAGQVFLSILDIQPANKARYRSESAVYWPGFSKAETQIDEFIVRYLIVFFSL